MQGFRAIKMRVGLPDLNKDVDRAAERCWVSMSYCLLMQRN